MAIGTTNVGFEEQLWQAADKLRSNMDAAEYKHVVLGLIFLKYVSDSFKEKYEQLLSEGYGDEEDRDEYIADNIFWVPKDARWDNIKAHATSTDIGEIIDNAMESIEKENDSLKGILTKNYSRRELNKTRLGVRRRIEIGFNSEFNSRRLPIRSRSNIYDCTHISEQPHIIVALFGSRNYPVLKQGHDLFRLCNNRELKSQPFEL